MFENLRKTISFVYEDKKGQITRRILNDYSITRKNKTVYITGKDVTRNNAIRKFIRKQIKAITDFDETKKPCYRCKEQYKDNKAFILGNIKRTYCMVCAKRANLIIDKAKCLNCNLTVLTNTNRHKNVFYNCKCE